MSNLRVAVLCDLAEEGWPSMDLVAEMLLSELGNGQSLPVRATGIRPSMRRRFSRPAAAYGRARKAAFSIDRAVNRLWDYPREVRRRRGEFDVFHLVDHSYSQLLHELPAERTVVTCHDLDTFRCVLEPEKEPRSAVFRSMTRHILNGFRRAGRVACVSTATRDEVVGRGLLAPERVVVVPNGVDPICSPDADPVADAEVVRLLGPKDQSRPELLHVGSTVARKRVEFLLEIVAAVGEEEPGVRLLRVGEALTDRQQDLVARLGLGDVIVSLPSVSRSVLSALYRRSDVLLQPSEREGFGLPVAEALACGTPVIASDLPVLREVAGDAAAYCALQDAEAWRDAVLRLLRERHESEKWAARRTAAVQWASRYSWQTHARSMLSIYRDLLES